MKETKRDENYSGENEVFNRANETSSPREAALTGPTWRTSHIALNPAKLEGITGRWYGKVRVIAAMVWYGWYGCYGS